MFEEIVLNDIVSALEKVKRIAVRETNDVISPRHSRDASIPRGNECRRSGVKFKG